MLKLKILFLITPLFLFVTNTKAQYLWYENDTQTELISFTNSSSGNFTTNETNPNINGVNSNAVTSKFVRQSYTTDGFTYMNGYILLCN